MKKRSLGILALTGLAIVSFGLTTAIATYVKQDARPGGPQKAPRPKTTVLDETGSFTPERLWSIHLENISRERGTIVSFDGEEGGPATEDQGLFADLFTVFDLEPAERLAHFQWLEQPGMSRNGWYAVVRDLVPDSGGMLVEVRMSPYLVSDRGGVTMTSDYFDEFYSLNPCGIEYLGGSAPPPNHPLGIFID